MSGNPSSVVVVENNIGLGGKARQNISPLAVRILSDPWEVESLGYAWTKMISAGPMQDFIWCQSCAETLLGEAKLAVVVVEDAHGIRALAPLVRRPSFPDGYEQLGVRELYEPGALLYTDKPALNALLDVLSHSGEPLTFGRIYLDTSTMAAIRLAFKGKGIVITRHCSGLPYIGLNAPDENVETLLSSRLCGDLRRARRKAETAGRVSFEIHSPRSVREFTPLFEEVLKVEAAGWKAGLGTDMATDTLRRNFFRRYGLRAAEKGILRIAFMRIDSEPVAMQFAVQTGGSFWLLKIGYKEAYSKCSPGMLLMLETLRFAAQQGLASYEFLGASEHWTRRWTACERASVRIDVYPFTIKGMCAFGREFARCAWVKASRKFRRPG
jgi:hypothetical protein